MNDQPTTTSAGGLRLSQRDLKVLRHVRRHRMTTVDILHQTLFPGMGRDAVKSNLRRLVGKPPKYRYLQPDSLDSQRVYYRLTNKSTRLLGASQDLARPLGPQAKVERYATLWFVCGDTSASRALFNPREFPDQFDLGNHRLPRATFYVEETSSKTNRLGYLLIDRRTHVRRLTRKAGDIMERFLRHGWFDDYLHDDAFALAVLTATEGKRQLLETSLPTYLEKRLATQLTRFQAVKSSLPFTIQVTVVPDLTQLVPSEE